MMLFAKRLVRHIPEEAGHDVWRSEDLEATGVHPEVFLRRIPSPQIATLVGAQYYWLRHHHPISLLGHIAAIESDHRPLGFAERLRDLTGYPENAITAIARHKVLDIRHKRNSLPLAPEHASALGLSGLHTMHAGIDVLTEIYAGVSSKRWSQRSLA